MAANGIFRSCVSCSRRSQRISATIEGYEVDREFPVIGRRIMLLNVRKVFYEKGTHAHRVAGL